LRLGEHFGASNDVINGAQRVGFRRRDLASGQCELDRLAAPEIMNKPLTVAPSGGRARESFWNREYGAFAGNANMAGQRELQGASHADAIVDGHHDGLGGEFDCCERSPSRLNQLELLLPGRVGQKVSGVGGKRRLPVGSI
jgi:hypothetical protein